MASTGPDTADATGTAVAGGGPAGARACHDLLVALAGRVPDRALWRLRDWLAAGADAALRTAVPRTLLRHRIGVTDTERELLREAVTAWRGSARLVDAVLHADTAPEAGTAFAEPGAAPWDTADLVLRAVVPAAGDVGEVRRAWRAGGSRVVLVSAAGDLAALTGIVQRALRAQGDAAPRVEVIGAGTLTTGYHRAALAASDVLWRAGAPATAGAPDHARLPDPRRGVPSSPPELVRHG
ncbi:hypothetical protein [Actinomycetospora corticicola]|uniref:Uncharacterized protein n=1 Tax=Actinomycetospora corticicola TaxID=663602 RepID=A0A7Y9E0H7_9PSEU|nr:hypothetical protein [Actinomycetospora corticicola]NYD38675.1 hypothetical protein [Actinomycetospora corticicola]